MAMAPTAAGPAPQGPLPLLRQQSLDGVVQQVADWSVPERVTAARCRVWTDASAGSEAGPQCDPPLLADSLAKRLAALREAWAAYRRLAPEAPASIEVTLAGGRFALLAPAAAVTSTSE